MGTYSTSPFFVEPVADPQAYTAVLRRCQFYVVLQVIHVGELFGDSISMRPGQSPWGRTTSQECQEELASKFHCILKVFNFVLSV